jgi:hypothetical protein
LFVGIDVLPPGSETTITAKTDVLKSDNNTQLIVYLRADEQVGYVNYNANLTLGAQIAFAIVAPIVFIFIYLKYT